MTRVLVSLIAALASTSFVAAEKATPSPTPTPERPRAIVNLLNDARLAAPELAVDTFLKVVESKKVTDPVWRKEILDEAWRVTDDVKYPVRKERAYYGTDIVDTVSGYMTYAYDLKLDALSLRARIIKNILSDDKVRARQMVFQIGGDLNLKPLTCEDAMAYVVSDIYEAVGEVAKASFTQREINEGLRALFVLPWIENIQSPAQIGPAADLVREIRGSTSERQITYNALGAKLAQNFDDDRTFTHAVTYQDFQRHLWPLLASSDETPQPDLLPPFRDFLTKNVTGPRCLDHKTKKGELPQFLVFANVLFPEKPFVASDFDTVEYRGVPNDKLYLNSETYKKVSLLFKTARETKNLPANQNDKSAQLDWKLKTNEVLDALDLWKASAEETESEVFNQKTTFYRAMLPEVSDPAMKTVVVRAFMRYMAGSPMQKDSFIEWLYHVRWLAAREPDLFRDLAAEFPCPNFKVMVATKKLGT